MQKLAIGFEFLEETEIHPERERKRETESMREGARVTRYIVGSIFCIYQ